MEFNLSNKKVLVTGSSSGIGKSLAKVFSSHGCQVALNGRDSSKLLKASNEINNSIFCEGDMSNAYQAKQVVEKCIAEWGDLDILICNIGSGKSVKPGHESYEEWQRVFSTNLWTATNSVEAAKKYLIKSRGVIVCISSICGLKAIKNAPVTYSVAKSALNSYVKNIARYFSDYGVRINAIAPGNILFDESTWSNKIKENPQDVEKYINDNVPMKIFGTPEDVGNIAVFLASPISNYVTGAIWTADGGQTA